MFEPNTVYAKIAYDAILLYLKTGKKLLKQENEIPPALKLNLPCYVSIYTGNKLKACSGTPEPAQKHLYNEIIENAVHAAFKHENSEQLKEEELNNISIVVDVMSEPKSVEDIGQLKPHKHGIIVEDGEGKKSLLLPQADGADTVEAQLNTAKENAGIAHETPVDQLKIYNFTTTKYQ